MNILYGCIIVCALGTHYLEGYSIHELRRIVVTHMAKKEGPRIFLLSYYRSGNTWLRYCIEYCTCRPTAHLINLSNPSNLPIGCLPETEGMGFDIDFSKAPVWKMHTPKERPMPDPTRDRLILLVRNPKEALLRHNGAPLTDYITGKADCTRYIDSLRAYQGWNVSRRLLIYYEDLILNPRDTLYRIVSFLQDDVHRVDEFFENYDVHRKMGLKLYDYNGSSLSGGQDVQYHSHDIPEEIKYAFDSWLSEKYPGVWPLLKDRYSQEVLASL